MTLSRLLILLFSALVALGVLRPSLPEAMRENWSGWVVALAAVTVGVALLWARSRETREERFEVYLLALLPLVLAALYLQPQRVASDGIFYYTPLHSLVVDGDLDFANEYRVLGAPAGYFQRTETGRLPNNFSIGPALLWLPWFVLAHLLGALGPLPPDRIRLPLFSPRSRRVPWRRDSSASYVSFASYAPTFPRVSPSSRRSWCGSQPSTFGTWYSSHRCRMPWRWRASPASFC